MSYGSLSQRGTLEPSRAVVVFWGVVMGSVAAIMLLLGDDGEALTGLQNLTIIAALPFALTRAQSAALADADTDLAGSAPMVRLLQGDVGCGKTVVAAAAAARAAGSGAQAALMAPTELLAEQHAGPDAERRAD